MNYCTEYGEMIGLEEESILFFSKVDRLEWRLKKDETTKDIICDVQWE